MSGLRRITDGVLFQAVLTGSLSFSHIHDLAAAHGQAGWKAWLYPLSVDLLTVAAYRKLMSARRIPSAPTSLAWCAFLLGLAASLAANIISAWQNPDRLIAVALGVWPAVAFLMCTLLAHDPAAESAALLEVESAANTDVTPDAVADAVGNPTRYSDVAGRIKKPSAVVPTMAVIPAGTIVAPVAKQSDTVRSPARTDTATKVAKLAAKGMSSRDIAAKVGRSERTVRRHLAAAPVVRANGYALPEGA